MNILNLTIFTQLTLESLPISSSTHVELLHALFVRMGHSVPMMTEAFAHLLYVPTIVIVYTALWYWYGNPRRYFERVPALRLFLLLWVSVGITVAAYYLLEKQYLCFQWSYAGGLLLTALCMLGAGLSHGKSARVQWGQAVIVGCAQALALGPGVSRLGITYAAGRIVGWHSVWALTYSLLLHLILMSGAVARVFFKQSRPPLAPFFSLSSMATIVLGALGGFVLLLCVMRLARQQRLWWVAGYLLPLSAFVFATRII